MHPVKEFINMLDLFSMGKLRYLMEILMKKIKVPDGKVEEAV